MLGHVSRWQGGFRLATIPAVFTVVFFTSSGVRAQWSDNPLVNTAICSVPGAQSNSVATSDGAGGAIIAWQDARPPVALGLNIYAQRVNAAGIVQWAINGVSICSVGGVQENPAIISDGAGGAFITWQDGRPGPTGIDIYAQHVNAAGVALWPFGGVPICAFIGTQIWPMLVSDAAGGAIITWEDERAGPGLWDIYAQHVNAFGLLLWPPLVGGVAIGVAPLMQLMPMPVEDGVGGAIITWYDLRGATMDIYAERVSAAGVPMWAPPGGVLICGPPAVPLGDQDQPTIATDGAGGAIITWQDGRTPLLGSQIYAQHVTPLGAVTWAGGVGIPVCAIIGDQTLPKIVSDGAGGAIITWTDGRPPLAGGTSIYAEHIDGLGGGAWAAPLGVPVCVQPGDQVLPKIVTDGAGGAIIAWSDNRAVLSFDIYAQRLNALGATQWPFPPGIPISVAPFDQNWAFQFIPMVADGNGGAIISWSDLRLAIDTDIYAQNVNADGTIGPRPLAYWRFEEGAGTTVGDASGNGHTGNFVNTPTFTPAVPCATVRGLADGFSLNFAGGGPNFPAVDIPDTLTLRPSDGITVEAWVRPNPGGVVISKQFYYGGGVSDVSSFELDVPNFGMGGVRFALSDTAGVQTEVTAFPGIPFPPTNQWAHVAGTWDTMSGKMRLYVNFVEVGSAVFAGPIGYDTSPTAIAANYSGPGGAITTSAFAGDIDEVRVFEVALTPAQMLTTTCPLAPLVVVFTPEADDTLVGNHLADFTWRAIDDGGVASIMVEVTTDGEVTYDTLATGEPNDGMYTWFAPPINSDQCRIRITAYDGASNSATASSTGFFHIFTLPSGITPVAPTRLSLSVYPNPFNPSLTVNYSIPARGPVEVAVFDVQGRRVAHARERGDSGRRTDRDVGWTRCARRRRRLGRVFRSTRARRENAGAQDGPPQVSSCEAREGKAIKEAAREGTDCRADASNTRTGAGRILVVPMRTLEEPAVLRRLPHRNRLRAGEVRDHGETSLRVVPLQADEQQPVLRRHPQDAAVDG